MLSFSSKVLHMRVLSIDDFTQAANNRRMNLREIGQRVKLRRVELNWTQGKLAEEADVALGTVQALEAAALLPKHKKPRQTSPENLQKIAKALQRSLDDLIADRRPIDPKNPLLEGLNEEHLEIARSYRNARRHVRERIELLLGNKEDDRLTKLIVLLYKLPPEDLDLVEQLTQQFAQLLASRRHL